MKQGIPASILLPQPAGVDAQRLQQQEDQVFAGESRDQMVLSEDTKEKNCRTKGDLAEKPTVVNANHRLPDLRRR